MRFAGPPPVRSRDSDSSSRQQEPTARRRYRKPEIVDRGRLVELALGGSPGVGDSGGGALVQKPLGT